MNNAPPSFPPLEFDHLVVLLRDELQARSAHFEADGYRLGAPGYHNLGSVNRLIVLESSYIELLGWPAGEAPKRKEIADQPLGLDALVFRSHDAQADYQRLLNAGFDINPVSALERPVEYRGKTETARFDTVRFARQPIAGLRIYFCQHLTPEYIWDTALMQHKNSMHDMQGITVESPEPLATAQILAQLVQGDVRQKDGKLLVKLPNLDLTVLHAPQAQSARIVDVSLRHADGSEHPFASHTD